MPSPQMCVLVSPPGPTSLVVLLAAVGRHARAFVAPAAALFSPSSATEGVGSEGTDVRGVLAAVAATAPTPMLVAIAGTNVTVFETAFLDDSFDLRAECREEPDFLDSLEALCFLLRRLRQDTPETSAKNPDRVQSVANKQHTGPLESLFQTSCCAGTSVMLHPVLIQAEYGSMHGRSKVWSVQSGTMLSCRRVHQQRCTGCPVSSKAAKA